MDLPTLAVTLIVVGSAVAFAWVKFFSPRRLRPGRKPAEILELEVQMRMATPARKIEAMHQLAVAYMKHRDRWAAESTLIAAIKLAENELGPESASLIPLLKEQQKVLRAQGRGAEATKLQERIDNLNERRND